MTARVVWRAVANKEINLNLLKVRKQAFGHESSKRRWMTARVSKRAVDISEINSSLLNERRQAFGHESSKRGSMTAGVQRGQWLSLKSSLRYCW